MSLEPSCSPSTSAGGPSRRRFSAGGNAQRRCPDGGAATISEAIDVTSGSVEGAYPISDGGFAFSRHPGLLLFPWKAGSPWGTLLALRGLMTIRADCQQGKSLVPMCGRLPPRPRHGL